MNMLVDYVALDVITETYKNGVKNWTRDEYFLMDCAYYEGKIKRACEVLNVSPTFSYLEEIPEEVSISYNYGYFSWD